MLIIISGLILEVTQVSFVLLQSAFNLLIDEAGSNHFVLDVLVGAVDLLQHIFSAQEVLEVVAGLQQSAERVAELVQLLGVNAFKAIFLVDGHQHSFQSFMIDGLVAPVCNWDA